jgi:hypothetical protein
MYNDELTKKLAETAKRIIAGESIEEATFKKGNMVTHKGKVGKITNVSGDKQSIDVEFNDGSTDSFEPNELKVFKEGAEKDTKGDKEAYQKFFNDTLKKYGVKSPAELKGDDEKKFYDEIDAGWKGDDEKPEKNESVELEEGKIDLNKKFNTSDAAFDYFHSFAVADQAKSDQEVETPTIEEVDPIKPHDLVEPSPII